MRSLVVHESAWGHTAAIAQAIAKGIGPEAAALSTAEATGSAIVDLDLLVAGCPVHAFGMPTERTRESVRQSPGKGPSPEVSHPTLRAWLAALPAAQSGARRAAAFDTRVRFPFGCAEARA